jgi:copper chaperone CopZ
MTHIIEVENIKCGGCVNSISKALMSLAGVSDASVTKETETITVQGVASRETITAKLTELGYPEKGRNSFLHQAKSFVSCAVGKVS